MTSLRLRIRGAGWHRGAAGRMRLLREDRRSHTEKTNALTIACFAQGFARQLADLKSPLNRQ
jgi:hypothetical protein